jgi:phage baseplate assembly protein W
MTTTNEYEVVGTPLDHVEIAPGGWQEIAQNIKTIITTWRGTVFLDRNFGINPAIIDQPENMVLPNLIMDITNQITNYEPRAEVTGISFNKSDAVTGEIIPVVTFRVKEGTLL